jgi:hypothetical protein
VNALIGFLRKLRNFFWPLAKVRFRDAAYAPRHRDSLKASRIGEIMDEWYACEKESVLSLAEKFASFKERFEEIPFRTSDKLSPRWGNSFLAPVDAVSVYGFLAERNPRYYVEVGSGNTTLFAARAIRDFGLRTKIISIDPFPRAKIDTLCEKIFRLPFEDMDLDFFSGLTNEDILLIDNSHRAFPNSDVTVFFTEVLPRLPKGILYTMHDIFLPSDYPDTWSRKDKRWYNEQYLLCAYLVGGAGGDRIKFPCSFLGGKKEVFEVFGGLWGAEGIFSGLEFDNGGFFWMEKG